MMDAVINFKESLSKRLVGSVGTLFAIQGEVPKGHRTIVPGIVDYVEPPKTASGWVPAYRYRDRHKNIDRSIPHVLKDIPVPVEPIVYFNPVEDVTSNQKLLEDLGFQDHTGRFHFYTKKRRTRINPINHQGIPGFKQDYVARVYMKEREMDIIWKRKS